MTGDLRPPAIVLSLTARFSRSLRRAKTVVIAWRWRSCYGSKGVVALCIVDPICRSCLEFHRARPVQLIPVGREVAQFFDPPIRSAKIFVVIWQMTFVLRFAGVAAPAIADLIVWRENGWRKQRKCPNSNGGPLTAVGIGCSQAGQAGRC